MARPKFVQIPSHPPERFRPLVGPGFGRIEAAAAQARHRFRGRAIWHVSSTLRGGGVAEMLRSLLPYVRGAGVDTRWLVLREQEEFFRLTKRIHNNLHGDRGDGGSLDAESKRIYESSLAKSARHFAELVQARDVVFLHDPQTAGLVPHLKAAGALVIWRCHVGTDEVDEIVSGARDFLLRYVGDADAWVFSRRQHAWQGLDPDRTWIMPPSLDPFSPKNQELPEGAVPAILDAIGLGAGPPHSPPGFTRADETPGRVERQAEVLQETPIREGEFVIAQISRWDRLKDPCGLLECFAAKCGDASVKLLLAGPATAAVADDPEGETVWQDVCAAWRQLPGDLRRRVHLASLPMDDLEENGAMVNALQRRADVVVQKSLAEGFGLTVAEAMWKATPVVGSRVGGIQDQIVDGVSGFLVNPLDCEGLAEAIEALHADPERATALGRQGQKRVAEHFLGAVRLAEYAERLAELDETQR